MKILKLSLCLGLFFILFSCNSKKKDSPPVALPCTGDCLFTIADADGSMVFMECFQKYAIATQDINNDSLTIWGIADIVAEEFQVEGMGVKFSAIFKENTLEPSFPDPSFDMNSLYQIQIISIE